MRKPLPFTLLVGINPCHLHDVRKMTQPDDTTKTLSKHEGSICYIPFFLSVDDLVGQDQYRRNSDPARAAPSTTHVILPHISPRPHRWTTLTLHLMGGHFAPVHRASRSPLVPAAAFFEEFLDLEGAAQTCTFFRSSPPSLGFGCPLPAPF
jgi:hypothetical protein